MPRLAPLAPETVTGPAKDMLVAVQSKLGRVPNMMRTMAAAPAVLQSYLAMSQALSHGQLPAKIREAIALAVGEANGCEYCISAHTMIGKMHGLSEDETLAIRKGEAIDQRIKAVVRFALAVNEKRGRVSDADFAAIRAAGLSDSEIAEVIGHVAFNVLTNYFNEAAHVDVDFPRIPLLSR